MLSLLGTRGWHVRTNAVTRCAYFHVNAVAKAEKATHRPESSQPKGKRGGVPESPWSAEELQTLKQMFEKGVERQDIANHLGRSRMSVNAKITYARDSERWTPVMQRWNEDQEKKLLDLRDQGKSFKEIGQIMGRSLGSVGNKFRVLRPGLSVRKWTDEEHETASKLHSKGYTCYQIAREMNRHPDTVAYYVIDGQYQRHHSAKPVREAYTTEASCPEDIC